MKILNIIILILGIGGGTIGNNFFSKIKLQKIERAHKKELSSKVDTLLTLRQNIKYLVSQDSLKSELISQTQLTLKNLKRTSTTQQIQLKACEAWKADAADGVIIEKDTVKVKRKLFGGYKIVN